VRFLVSNGKPKELVHAISSNELKSQPKRVRDVNPRFRARSELRTSNGIEQERVHIQTSWGHKQYSHDYAFKEQ